MGQTIQDNVTSVKPQRHRKPNSTQAPSRRQTNALPTPPPNSTKILSIQYMTPLSPIFTLYHQDKWIVFFCIISLFCRCPLVVSPRVPGVLFVHFCLVEHILTISIRLSLWRKKKNERKRIISLHHSYFILSLTHCAIISNTYIFKTNFQNVFSSFICCFKKFQFPHSKWLQR